MYRLLCIYNCDLSICKKKKKNVSDNSKMFSGNCIENIELFLKQFCEPLLNTDVASNFSNLFLGTKKMC